ncbi:hypothetical protein M8542_40755 [Amycolatopsis sp. OK19-0408]|uniref:Uncharacterized protein n=1 Tax=Amycolatopsis iheyensis TaxID=2945988 RepID=A0A9X2SPX9_9PSEU|nr:hypothetical protein [Amycolatopsis iheyensis]MCR6489173.1 hypothetical protein [Amycolatopsis iheyensis]
MTVRWVENTRPRETPPDGVRSARTTRARAAEPAGPPARRAADERDRR